MTVKCRLCPVRRHCHDYGNCGNCDHKKAYESIYRKGYVAGKKDAVVHGRWIEHRDSYENTCCCSKCKYVPDNPMDETLFCPNCGALMDLYGKDENGD